MTKIDAIEELNLLVDAAHTCSEDWFEVEWANYDREVAELNKIINSH